MSYHFFIIKWLLNNCFDNMNSHIYITLPYQVELARHSMTRFLHSSLFPITVFSSSVVHPLSSLSCAVYVLFGRPGFRCPCKGSHRSTSLII